MSANQGAPRTVIIHLHLFKNAGTSIERSLQAAFGDGWVSYDSHNPGGRLSQTELEAFIGQHPNVSAISSHQIRPPLRSFGAIELWPLVFLRHPLDRIRSAYDFERTQGDVSPSSRAAAANSLAEWIEFHHGRNSNQCSNFQTYALSSLRGESNHAPLMARPVTEHLESAKAFLSDVVVIGLVEEFDRTWSHTAKAIQDGFPGIELRTHWDNAAPGQAVQADLNARLSALRYRLGGDGYEQLVEANQADLALHDWAKTQNQRTS